jgi:hypothetical protein
LNLKSALNRSDQFQSDLVSLFELGMDQDSARDVGCKVLCSVAIEHAESIRHLLRKKLPTSAIGLLRIQYETFVRAVWLLHAASDSHVRALMDSNNLMDEKKANSFPMLAEMIDAMEGKAPEPAVAMIKDVKVGSWRYLSSHVHGGYYALHLHGRGVPPEHSAEILKMSNGLLALIGIVLCSVSFEQAGIDVLRALKSRYIDIFPEFAE